MSTNQLLINTRLSKTVLPKNFLLNEVLFKPLLLKNLLPKIGLYKTLILLSLSLVAIQFSKNANAKDYMVEVLIFENNNVSRSTESNAYEAPKRMKSGSKAWLIAPTMLNTQAESIQSSPDYQLKHHYSWGIESLPFEDSANYTIVEAESQGYIKVYADHLLFANIDLDYKGYRMKEKRRLKLNEKHFFDHPKFGMLMQVSRLPEQEKLEEVAEIAPE